ncbi:TPA: quaternary ammonium compound-resistance protein SugE, partial [Escherichia coli]|nr:quaternary ammonium compound-resistance protein SugE [Salmonella enterica subsp. enterica]HAO0978255.1 quaternary ammonium compound-resistance protein SugE [Escherichia coli]
MSIPFTADDSAIGTPAKSKNNPPANASFTGDGPIVLEPDMSWIVLLIAGLLEVVWAI